MGILGILLFVCYIIITLVLGTEKIYLMKSNSSIHNTFYSHVLEVSVRVFVFIFLENKHGI